MSTGLYVQLISFSLLWLWRLWRLWRFWRLLPRWPSDGVRDVVQEGWYIKK